jgi:pyrroloquinoline quinone (PQQ) biosynthesis protein C
VEHFKSPFGPGDFVTERTIENQKFFDEMLFRSKGHRFYSHPFISTLNEMRPSRDAVSFMLTSFYKVVSPFTGLLCSLGGRAPNLRSRFALMDNIYEEMGCGDLSSAHPNLYLKMLSSIGVTPNAAESAPTLATIRRINDHLREVVERRNFSVACAVLASAEAAIPPSFPVIARLAQQAFPDIDMTFFDRHGPRDDEHADDAAMLFAVTASSVDFQAVDDEVKLDLDFRAELFDDWMLAITRGIQPRPEVRASERPARRPSVRPPSMRPGSVRPPASVRPASVGPSARPSAPPPSMTQ